MIEMKYRTRGNSEPYGKNKVFFTSYPEDHEKHFERTADLLLKHQNCVIFYLEPESTIRLYHKLNTAPESQDERGENEILEIMADLESRISEMQLIVVPVTTKLLTKMNLAMGVIYKIAERRHIPVLPLMMETGLDDLFTDRFGDLQYLQPENPDPTSLPFEEKLEKYLNGVLVGDDLAEKVRGAFDAYIFLSYRKKDRAFAQQLMRIIHRNRQCRDIAIWYDEFLVPGEDFTLAIMTALKKSKLFTLVVTPNLLEEGNYVMQYEYPVAREQGKGILPVEMKKTNLDLLRCFYEAFPECISLEDQEKWEKSIADYLKGIAVDENNEDPAHNFLIGLAYLDGIDMEVDSNRAVELITGAAETGLEEAIIKLVSMYHDGKGVARNYEISVEWQQKLVDMREEKYRSSQSEDDRYQLIGALWGLGDAWFEMWNLKSAMKAYLKMLAVASEGEQETGRSRKYLAVSNGKLGDTEIALGRLKEAAEHYRKALAISKEMTEATGTVEARQDLSVSYNRLGDTEKTSGHLKEAAEYYRKALTIRKELAEEIGTAETRRDLSVSYNRLGDTEKALGHLKEAGEYYRKALTISEGLAEETATVEARRDLSVSYNRLGDTEKALSHLKEAGEYYRKCLAISRELAEETGMVEVRRDLSLSYTRLGDIEKALGQLDEAGEYYRKGLAISRELAEEIGTVKARRDLSRNYNMLGDIEKALGHPNEAGEYYRKGLVINEELAEETVIVEVRLSLSSSYHRLGDIEYMLGHLREAEEYYRKALKVCEELAEGIDTVDVRLGLSVSYNRLGAIEKMLGRLKEAEEYYMKLLKICEELVEETGMVEAHRNLSVSYEQLGDLEKVQGHLKEAGEYYGKSLKIREDLVDKVGTVRTYRDLMIILYKISMVGEELFGTQYAIELMKKALKIAETLADTVQTEQAAMELSMVQNYLNKLLFR